MSNEQTQVWIEASLEQLEELKYQYIKTGLFEALEAYFKLSNELLSYGVKPEHLPMIQKRSDHV